MILLTGSQCDENKPQCDKCVRYNTRCSFLQLQATRPSDTPANRPSPNHQNSAPNTSSRTSPYPSTSPHPASGLPSLGLPEVFTIQDLEFLHHYTTQTWHTISHLHFWQHAVPQIAVQFPFLMHCILALGARHLAYLRPAQRATLSIASSRHHQQGLTGYRNALANINKHNCHACAAFSLMLNVYAWACPDRPGALFLTDDALRGTPSATGVTLSQVTGEVELIAVLRGGNAVMADAKHWIVDGPLAALYRPWFGWNQNPEFSRLPSVQSLLQRSEDASPVQPHEDNKRLELLAALWAPRSPLMGVAPPSPISTNSPHGGSPYPAPVNHHSPHPHSPYAPPNLNPSSSSGRSPAGLTPTEITVLDAALVLLRRVYMITSNTNLSIESQAATLAWPITISDAYLGMVQARNPYALVILAHYCILLKREEGRWWIEGKAEELLQRITGALERQDTIPGINGGRPSSWLDWIQWPLGEVGQRLSRHPSEAGTPGSFQAPHSQPHSQGGTPVSMPTPMSQMSMPPAPVQPQVQQDYKMEDRPDRGYQPQYQPHSLPHPHPQHQESYPPSMDHDVRMK